MAKLSDTTITVKTPKPHDLTITVAGPYNTVTTQASIPGEYTHASPAELREALLKDAERAINAWMAAELRYTDAVVREGGYQWSDGKEYSAWVDSLNDAKYEKAGA